MHIVFLVDARAHAGCACSSYKDVSFRSKGDSSVDGEGGDGPALWESLEKYPECVCVAVIRTLVAIGAADKGRLHWSIQLFDWESSGGCTPDELYRHLRPRTDTLSSRSSLNFQDLSKTCRFVTSAEDDDFSALAQHVRFVHSSLSERLYDLPIFSSEQRKRNAVEILWKSLAYVLTSYDWASIAHSTDDVCAVVVLAPMRAVSGGDGGTSDIASFQKLRPHIDKHRLKLIWLDSDRREGDGNVSTPSSLLAVNFGVMPLSDVLSPVTPQHQFAVELTRLVSTSYSATAQLQPPSVSVPRFVGFDFLGPSVWPPTPQSRALGVPTKLYRWLTCGCRCPTGTTCMLSSLPTTQLQTNALRSASTPITVHGTVNASDIMPEWIGRKHVWTLIPNAGSVSLFQAPEGITPSHTPPVWLISFSRPSHATDPPVATGPPRSPVPLPGHSPSEGNTVYYLMLPMSPTEATIREVLCSPATLRGLLTLPDAESTEAISSTDGLARPVLALSMSRRVPPKSFSHELHSRATRLLMRSVVKTVQEPVSVTPPKLSREALLEYIDKCHKDIGVPTGRFSPSELLSSSSSEEEAGEEEEDVRMTGPDLIAGTHVVMLDSASRDGFPVDSGPDDGEPLPSLEVFKHLPRNLCKILLKLHAAYEDILNFGTDAPSYFITSVFPEVCREVAVYPLRNKHSSRPSKPHKHKREEFDLEPVLSKYVGRKDLWWFPSGDVTPAVEDADGWNCRKPIIGRSVAASLVRAYVREHLLVGREEIQSIYAPSVVAAPSIKQQNPFRHIFAGSGARRAATALPVIGDSSSEEEMREPPETVPSAVQRDDASNPTVPVDGWGGTAEDDGLGAMVLGPTASPKRSTRASPEKSMAEAMRRLTSGRSLGFGAPVKPSAPSSLVPVPDTRIRRIKFGKLERLRETLLQVLIQLQLSAMTSVAQKHKSSTGSVVRDDTTVLDPVPTRVIQDIQNTLSMAFFSVDASLTPDLITMIGPLPPSESAFTVESVVMLSIVPLFQHRLPRSLLMLCEAFEFQELPPALAVLKQPPQEVSQPPSGVVRKLVQPAKVVIERAPVPAPAVTHTLDPTVVGPLSLLGHPSRLFNEVTIRASSRITGEVTKKEKKHKRPHREGKHKKAESPNARKRPAVIPHTVQATPLKGKATSVEVRPTAIITATPLRVMKPPLQVPVVIPKSKALEFNASNSGEAPSATSAPAPTLIDVPSLTTIPVTVSPRASTPKRKAVMSPAAVAPVAMSPPAITPKKAKGASLASLLAPQSPPPSRRVPKATPAATPPVVVTMALPPPPLPPPPSPTPRSSLVSPTPRASPGPVPAMWLQPTPDPPPSPEPQMPIWPPRASSLLKLGHPASAGVRTKGPTVGKAATQAAPRRPSLFNAATAKQ